MNGAAYDIAASLSPALRVAAGPGTGKTFALMRRVARLLEEGVHPYRIFVVTFTRTAAQDLLDSLERLDVPGSLDVRVGTLHRFCFQALSRSAILTTTGRVPRPLMGFEVRFLEEDLKRPGRGIRVCRALIKGFEAAWARLQHDTPGWPPDDEAQAFHRELKNWLIGHRCMLLGELITEMHGYMRNNPACPERRAFDHVLVDEYQDLNRADQEVIGLFAEAGSLTVIGDEDQAIYSRLRYAQPEGIREFAVTHPGTDDQPLVVCRRCPTTIVSMASCLIAHNALREPRQLEPFLGRPEGNVKILQWETVEDEAAGLADRIQSWLTETGSELRDVLVLAPRRSIGYLIRDNLIRRGVLAHSYFFEEALETERAQERVTLLNLLVNANDRVALRCWLGFGHNSLAAVVYARFRSHYEAEGVDPLTMLQQIRSGAVSFVGSSVLAARHATLEAELARLEELEDEALVDALFPEGDDEVRPVRRIAQLALEVATEPLDARALFNDIRTRIIYPEPPPAGEYVRVMSLHKSKGLTARLVVVAGCVEGWIPSLGVDLTGDEARRDLEEQRRLFYVALTRATDALILSSFRSLPSPLAHRMQVRVQTRQGGRAFVQASRFLAELGPNAPAPRLG